MAAMLVAAMLAAPAAIANDPLAAAPSHFADFDGTRIHYKSLGAGNEGIVLVHGWSCNLGFWAGQAPLAAHTRVVALDLPGHGASDKPDVAYTMALFARAIDAVMRDAGLERAVLVGHSMGTPVVWQFSRLFPAKTRALVAVDGGFRSQVTGAAEREKYAARYKGPDYKATMAGIVDFLLGPMPDAAMRERVKSGMLATPQHVVASAAFEMSEPRVFAPEPKIGVPVLAVYSSFPIWSAEYRKAIEAFIPRLDYRTMDGVGHFLMMEKPEAFNAMLLDFLAREKLLTLP